MTQIESYLIEQIQQAEYIEEGMKQSWVERIRKDGLNPTTTRLLLQTMLDHALSKMTVQADPIDPSFVARYQQLMTEVDHVETKFQSS